MLVLSFDKITVLAAISEGYYTTTGETGQELYDRRRIYQGKATGAFNSMGPLKNKGSIINVGVNRESGMLQHFFREKIVEHR